MDPIIITLLAAVVLGFVLTAALGKVVIPALRRMKAGQSIKEDGPPWHMAKQGTPTMGGVMFILAVIVTVLVLNASAILAGDLTSVFVLLFSLVFGLAATAVISLVSILCLPALLRAIQTPEELFSYTRVYLTIVLASLPAAFLYNLYNALLRSVGSTGAALGVLPLSVGLNLALSLLFVAKLSMGSAGAAGATARAQAFSAAACFFYLYKAHPALIFTKEDCRMDRELLKRTAHFSFVTAMHQSGLYLGKLLVQGAVNSMGTDLISAYTTTTRIAGFANSAGDSCAAATGVLVAQNLGAKQDERVKKAYKTTLLINAALGLVCTVVLYVFAPQSSAWLLGESSGVAFENAVSYLRTVALFYVLCYTGNAFVGYLDGIGKVTLPLIGACSHISMRALLSWLWIAGMGRIAVALATGIGWIWCNLFWLVCCMVIHKKQKVSV